MMKKIFAMLLICLLLPGLCCAPTSATFDETVQDYDGYIVKVRENSDVVQLMEVNLEPLDAERCLYTCDTAGQTLECLESGIAEYVEPDYTVSLLSEDEYYTSQWNLSMINASAAWEESLNGEGIRIGLIDSGINRDHADFAGVNIDTGWNFRSSNSNTSDTYGHGTKVAGIIAAARNNGIGIAGITSGATLVPLKCFEGKDCTISCIIEAVYAAADKYSCDVLNLSLGLTQQSASFKSAIQYASEKGIIMIASAGNTGGTELYYPAAYDCVIGVGSVGKTGNVSSFSQKNNSVFVVAPGGENYGDSNTENDEPIYTLSKKNNDIAKGIGTSFAAPHVSALAVIAKEYNSDVTTEEFKQLLIKSSKDLGDSGYDTSYGYGLVDTAAFIDALKSTNIQDSSFSDISGSWAEKYINYCSENGLMSGIGDNKFSPTGTMSRAMFIKSLANLNGGDTSGYTVSFSDVREDAWYADSVAWGAANGIVSGMSDTEFGPNYMVNREQMAVFLYRYAKYAGYANMTGNLSELDIFSDRDSVSSWAAEATAWAVEHGLLNGKDGGVFDPSGTATRAEAAAILARFHSLVQK